MNYSAIILSGGSSNRFGTNKSLTPILGKPMICYVVNVIRPLVDEILIITDVESNKNKLSKLFDSSIQILLDEYNLKSPIIGAITGFKHAKGEYSLLLACDTPLISVEVISLLLAISKNYEVVVPRWPNGNIEPLQAVYNSKKASEASHEAITQKEYRMNSIIARLRKVLYISTIALSKLDPKLYTFFNVNTPEDLSYITRILKIRQQ